eukprot:15312276-Ditylum_brightwellii.AAC.1
MAIEETKFDEPTSTGLVDDNPTNKADDGIVTWDDFVSNQSEEIPPKCGGFVFAKDDKILAFVGTDPVAKVNVFSYDPSSKRYTANKRLLNKNFQAVKGPVNNDQYHPVDLKAIKLVEEVCTKYVGTKFEGLAGKDGRSPPLALSVYKDIIRKHPIHFLNPYLLTTSSPLIQSAKQPFDSCSRRALNAFQPWYYPPTKPEQHHFKK